MVVMIDSWPLPRMPLRCLRIRGGMYQAIAGDAPRRIRYTIAGHHRRWHVERSLQRPGGGWAMVSVQPADSLKAAMDRCDVDAQKNEARPSPGAAAYRARVQRMV